MSTEFAQLQGRRDTAANWTSTNPVLASGERGFETDTGKEKIGDGATAWTSLKYTTDTSNLPAAVGKATSTDGTYGLPQPTGVGLELIYTTTNSVAGLNDIHFNGNPS